MSIVYGWPTSATLQGAVNLSRIHRVAGQEDLGFKIEQAISAVNDMQSSVKTNASAVTFLNLAVNALNCAVSGIFSNISAIQDSAAVSGVTSSEDLQSAVVSALSAGVSSLSNFRA